MRWGCCVSVGGVGLCTVYVTGRGALCPTRGGESTPTRRILQTLYFPPAGGGFFFGNFSHPPGADFFDGIGIRPSRGGVRFSLGGVHPFQVVGVYARLGGGVRLCFCWRLWRPPRSRLCPYTARVRATVPAWSVRSHVPLARTWVFVAPCGVGKLGCAREYSLESLSWWQWTSRPPAGVEKVGLWKATRGGLTAG